MVLSLDLAACGSQQPQHQHRQGLLLGHQKDQVWHHPPHLFQSQYPSSLQLSIPEHLLLQGFDCLLFVRLGPR